ncbi:hypothetical protein JCM24511_07827 [Saitozyma sp. JCM 24511]|nr:hypothetical protein JCM24511_07827 [Saitozyma sp. JCM 24511]
MSLASSSSSAVSVIRSAVRSSGATTAKRIVSIRRSHARNFAAAAALPSEPDLEHLHDSPPPPVSPSRPSRSAGPSRIDPSSAQAYLSDLLRLPASSAFPPDLALQLLTHKSYRYAHAIRQSSPRFSSSVGGSPELELEASCAPHNARFSFLGRRALASYLALFVHSTMSSSRELQALDFLRGHALEDKLAAMRHLNNLGREVGERWGVGEVMRWDRNQTSLSTGDLRLKGLTVESILGGVFSLHGSPAAQRTFHLHILPALSNQLRDPRLKERAEEMRQAIDREFDGGIVKP